MFSGICSRSAETTSTKAGDSNLDLGLGGGTGSITVGVLDGIIGGVRSMTELLYSRESAGVFTPECSPTAPSEHFPAAGLLGQENWEQRGDSLRG